MKHVFLLKTITIICFLSFVKINNAAGQCSVSITQNPAGMPCTNPTLTANFSGLMNPPVPGNAYFICDSNPWASDVYDTAMNYVFGMGNWTSLNYTNADPVIIFSPSTQFVYMEGSDGNELEQTAYLAANLPAIEAWVAAGGRLLINRAPNAGAATTSFGFGGVINHYTNPQNNVNITPGHAVGAGPFSPSGYGPYIGGSFSHAYITGGNVMPIITGSGVNILAEKNWGDGLVLFGGYTTASFWSPAPNAQNLFQNFIDYAANSSQPPATSYLWMPGGDTTMSVVANVTGIYTVTVTQSGCTATSTISVSINPPIAMNVTAGNGVITSNPTGGTPPYQYSLNGGPFTPNNTFNNLCPNNYTLIVKDNFGAGCTKDTVISLIDTSVTTLTQTACFSFFFNGNYLTSSGTYNAIFVNANGCDSVVNLILTINTVNNSITQTAGVLTASAAGAAYQWLDCNTNTPINGAISQSYTPAVSGSYAAIVTQNGCTDTSVCETVVISGIEGHDKKDILFIYPNPASDNLYIESVAAFSEIVIYDIQMKKLTTIELEKSNKASISTKELSNGMYFFSINNGPIRKLVINK